MFHFENELEKTISDEIQIYAEKEYASQLITIMLLKHVSSHVSISVDSMSLFESSILFAHYVFQNPRRALLLLDDAFQKVASDISKNHVSKSDMVFKENLHVRLIALPNLPEIYRSNLPTCSDVGQFLCISGTVVRTSTAKMLQYKKEWRCGKCKYQFTVKAEVEQGYVCEKPQYCYNPEWCGGKNFTLMSSDINAEWCKDYQEIKLQEQVYNLNVGTVPKSMLVVLEDDLVESCHPGNDVIVSGVLLQQWKPLVKGSVINIQLIILAHNIEVQNKMSSGIISKDMAKEFGQFWQDHKSDPLEGRNFILSCICPQVFGLYIVKLSVALVLASGVQKQSGSSRIRGDTHLLLVGDPGTAKSQFLKFAAKVSSRSVITSGIGTTNAGLTVSAVKESSRWELEAGALVLADGGICCIDEFSCIKEQDKTCIHEAMEQQTISVAKAGLVCSLNTRCSILAATNPKGKYDENMSLSENTALGSPLLSRFDIILVLLDTYDEKWDDMVASYILDGRNLINETNSKLWPAAKVKNYFTLIRHINPKVSADAERVLRAYYTRQRSLQSRQASRTTPRLLQSLIRLAEGHARLMFRSEVLVSDAVTAIILIESSMLGNSILEGLSPLHTVFPDNPEAEYFEKAACIFKNLDIESPAEESFGCFYEESTLNRLLLNISSVWSPKEDPFIFGGSACNSSHNSDLFQETLADKNESSTSKLQSFEDPTKSTENFFCVSTEKPPTSLQGYHHVQDTVMAEIHRNGDIIPNTIQNPNENEVHHPSPADMLVEEMTNLDTSSGALNNSQVKTSQVSILDQILCEDFEGNNDASLNPSHIALCAPGTISENQTVTSRTKAFSKNFLEKQRSQEIISKKHPHERNKVDILEELGISSSEELINSANNALDLPTKALHSSSEKYRDASSMLKAKKSIAEQLKSFTFKQCQVDTRNSSNQSIKSLSNNNLKSSSKIGKDFSSNEDCDSKVEIASQSSRKNAVFHMIKNKSKSCFTDKVCPSTSKIAENDQSTQNKSSNILNIKMKSKDSPSESTSIHVGNDPSRDSQSLSVAINNTTESASIDLENQTNRHSLSSLPAINTDKPELTNEKKSVRNDLKKFAFSKIKFSKNLNS